MMMKIRLLFIILLAGSVSCRTSTSRLPDQGLSDGQVAAFNQVGNHQVTVCDLDLLKDTVAVPLSALTEELQIIKLDDRPEALVITVGNPIVGEQYILLPGSYWVGRIPHKLFDKSGKFIANVGGIGKGPGEYQDIFTQQLDEKHNRIYLLPWRSNGILVYDMEGKPIPSIPLPERIHIGRFRVNRDEGIVSMVVAPLNGYQTAIPATVHLAWSQDMSGKVIKGISPKNFTSIDMLRFDRNHPYSFGNTQNHDIHIRAHPDRQDTLYHYDVPTNRLIPQFTVNFKGGKIPFHIYNELPHHYLCYTSEMILSRYPTVPNKHNNPATTLIEKSTLKGSYIKLVNDFLGNMVVDYSPVYCFEYGNFVMNYDPSRLLEDLEEALSKNTMSAEMREKLIKLKNSIKETDNNYILYAKLKQ